MLRANRPLQQRDLRGQDRPQVHAHQTPSKRQGEARHHHASFTHLTLLPTSPPQMAMEIEIHKSLNHKHIVKFHGFFEDKENIYILLELCRRRVSTHTPQSSPMPLHLVPTPPLPVPYGVAQAPQGSDRARGALPNAADPTGRGPPPPQQHYTPRHQTWEPLPQR